MCGEIAEDHTDMILMLLLYSEVNSVEYEDERRKMISFSDGIKMVVPLHPTNHVELAMMERNEVTFADLSVCLMTMKVMMRKTSHASRRYVKLLLLLLLLTQQPLRQLMQLVEGETVSVTKLALPLPLLLLVFLFPPCKLSDDPQTLSAADYTVQSDLVINCLQSESNASLITNSKHNTKSQSST